MTDQPIPTRGLLGAWFFDERQYDVQRDEVHSLNPTGYPAKLKNGVTMGQSGDPSRELEAANFDPNSDQHAIVDDNLSADERATVVVGLQRSWTDTVDRIVTTGDPSRSANGDRLVVSSSSEGAVLYESADGSGSKVSMQAQTPASNNEWWVLTAFQHNGEIGIYYNNSLQKTVGISGFTEGISKLVIGKTQTDSLSHWDGEIAAVGRYDLTPPNAPEPSEIATAWDRLTDIPATR